MDRAHEPVGPVLTSRPARTSHRVDRELEVGARAHFEDAAYYTSAYEGRVEDVAYYARVAKGKAAVLEHGVGNGRVALPIARQGSELYGVDHARPMLDDLRAILRGEPREVQRRVHLCAGDIRRVRLGRRFPLVICPFNTALHLYTRQDVERWLARVREHLSPRGELVFDVSMPILEDLTRHPGVPYRTPPLDHPTLGRVNYSEHFDYDRVRQILFVSMCFERRVDSARGGARRRSDRREGQTVMTPLAHRQFFPRELEALLHYNGFEVTALFGDFAGGPLTQASDVMVWHARAARRGAR